MEIIEKLNKFNASPNATSIISIFTVEKFFQIIGTMIEMESNHWTDHIQAPSIEQWKAKYL